MAQSLVWLDETERRSVEPSAGWNASATAQDKVRWATLYTWLIRKGLEPAAASSMATMKMFQLQTPGLRYGRTQERRMETWIGRQ